jgi:hypothetical protein
MDPERENYADPDPTPRWARSTTVEIVLAAFVWLGAGIAFLTLFRALCPDLPWD